MQLRISGLNPRYVHTFADEDYMSVLKHWSKRKGRQRKRGGRPVSVLKLARMRLLSMRWRIPELNRCRLFKR